MEYWFELCDSLGIQDVCVVMSDFAAEVEAYAGDGARWGLKISYGFEKEDAAPTAYLRRSPEQWNGGLLHIRGPLFPARTEAYSQEGAAEKLCGGFIAGDGSRLVVARTEAAVAAYLNGETPDPLSAACGIEPVALASTADFFAINQRMVGGEALRYLTSGYQVTADNCHIGMNTIIPPTAKIQPPVIIGDNCRIGDLANVGPGAVIGNHVVIDHNTTLEKCVILDNSYVGKSMEIQGKVICGNHLYDVECGLVMNLEEPWLLDSTHQVRKARDRRRAFFGWVLALVSVLLMLVPYVLLRALLGPKWSPGERKILRAVNGKSVTLPWGSAPVNPSKRLRLFYGFSLDRFPHLLRVLSGKLWLCGHPVTLPLYAAAVVDELPHYFPAAISYADFQPESDQSESTLRVDALYYLEKRSSLEDLRVFLRFIVYRMFSIGAG
jgi:hypothetical protein